LGISLDGSAAFAGVAGAAGVAFGAVGDGVDALAFGADFLASACFLYFSTRAFLISSLLLAAGVALGTGAGLTVSIDS